MSNDEPYDVTNDECIDQSLVPFGVVCVTGSMVSRLVGMMRGIGCPLIGSSDDEHPTRIVLRFDSDPCITTITLEDAEKL